MIKHNCWIKTSTVEQLTKSIYQEQSLYHVVHCQHSTQLIYSPIIHDCHQQGAYTFPTGWLYNEEPSLILHVLGEQIMFWVEHMRRLSQKFLFVASHQLIAVCIRQGIWDFTVALGLLLNCQTKPKTNSVKHFQYNSLIKKKRAHQLTVCSTPSFTWKPGWEEKRSLGPSNVTGQDGEKGKAFFKIYRRLAYL